MKDETIQIRVTKAEKEAYFAEAKLFGLIFSEWARRKLGMFNANDESIKRSEEWINSILNK